MTDVWSQSDLSAEDKGKRADDRDYKWVFVEDQWIPAKVTPKGSYCFQAVTENGVSFECSNDQIHDNVLSIAGLKRLPDNLLHTDDMSEPTIIYMICKKYLSDLIYTSIGDILISVNPYCLLPLYTPLVMHKYMEPDNNDLRPHPYEIARRAHENMLTHFKMQAILISGESGFKNMYVLN